MIYLQVSEQSTLVVGSTDTSLSSLWATPSWRSSSSGSSSHSHSLEAVISDYNRLIQTHIFSLICESSSCLDTDNNGYLDFKEFNQANNQIIRITELSEL